MNIKILKIAAVTIFAMVLAALFWNNGGVDMASGMQTRRISAAEARKLMQNNPSAIILDVRTEREFATGRIPGAILLPDTDVKYNASKVLPIKNAMILVYCRSGIRSSSAAALLVSMGYTNVYDFGGIMSWPYEVE